MNIDNYLNEQMKKQESEKILKERRLLQRAKESKRE